MTFVFFYDENSPQNIPLGINCICSIKNSVINLLTSPPAFNKKHTKTTNFCCKINAKNVLLISMAHTKRERMNDEFVQLTWKMMPSLAKIVKRAVGREWKLCWVVKWLWEREGCCILLKLLRKMIIPTCFTIHRKFKNFVVRRKAWIYWFSTIPFLVNQDMSQWTLCFIRWTYRTLH